MVEGETLLVLLLCARCQRSASTWRPDLLKEASGTLRAQLQKQAVRVRACMIGCLSFQGAPDESN